MIPSGFGGFEIAFVLLWLLFVLGGVAGWIVFLVAVWRLMKAHEVLAKGIQSLASRTTSGQ